MTNDEKNPADKIVGSSDGLERMLISTDESVALIRASTRDHVVQCKFGPGWVALLPVESNRWAFNLIRDVRSNAELRREP